MTDPVNLPAAAAGTDAAAAITGAAAAFPPMFTVEPFDRNKSKWSRWVKRFEGALNIFAVPPANRKEMILYYMGAETYNLLCDHLAPAEPENKTYQEIVTALEKFFDPEPLEMVELWKFRSRVQKEGESVMDFVTALQRESKYCHFGDYLEKALRNQLVFGLRNQRVKTRLIEEKELTFEKAKEIAVSMEASGEGVEVLNWKVHELNLVDKFYNRDQRPTSKDRRMTTRESGTASKVTNTTTNKCFRCGSETHLANRCVHKNTVCNN